MQGAKPGKVLLLVLAALLVGSAGIAAWVGRRSMPLLRGEIAAAVSSPVEIFRDEYGVPHIFAGNMEDLFYAQGYAQAQDRLWQMDLSRRIAGGKLSAILGADFLEVDRFSLTVGFNRAARADYGAFDAQSQKLLQAYARGVNAYIEDHRTGLPLEFTLLGYTPEPWEPADSLAISKYLAWYLGGNMSTELFLSALIAAVGEEKAAELFPVYPADGQVVVPSIPAGETAFAFPQVPALLKLAELAALGEAAAFAPGLGSNSWVIGGEKTAGGAALLANDMHFDLGLPAVWHQCHLVLEGEFSAAGVAPPGMPGIIAGFNEHIAWGVTNTGADVQDLYLMEFNPKNPRQYLYCGEWEEARVVVEKIEVKGEDEPRELAVTVTRFGPVISAAAGLTQPLSLCWTGLQPTREFVAFQRLLRATDWEEFLAALENHMVPPRNFVYADREGNIGCRTSGLIPIRRQGQGLLPVSGSSDEFAWDGFIPFEELPQVYNPPEGIIVAANQRVAGDDYPYFITAEWAAPYRAMSILKELSVGERLTLEDMARAQNSFFNTQVEILAPIILAALDKAELDGTGREALQLFRQWSANPVEQPDEPGPAIFNVFYRRLLSEIFAAAMGDDLYGQLLQYRAVVSVMDRMLTAGESLWFGDRELEEIITAAFQGAVQELTGSLGPQPDTWQWGNLHTVTFCHDLSSLMPLSRVYNRGPFPAGGSLLTPACMGYAPDRPYTVTIAAPWRYMVDLYDFTARDVLAAGNSGHPFSRHYDDQLELWLHGQYKEMLFDAERCLSLPDRLVLLPQ